MRAMRTKVKLLCMRCEVRIDEADNGGVSSLLCSHGFFPWDGVSKISRYLTSRNVQKIETICMDSFFFGRDRMKSSFLATDFLLGKMIVRQVHLRDTRAVA